MLYEMDTHILESSVHRYQVYMGNWEITLDEMISDELILLDASQKEVNISEGEIREKFDERYGPNVMQSLAKLNLSFEEAREMIRNEIIVRQLMGFKVHSKIFQSITPDVIRSSYRIYVKENPPTDQWEYQMLSIRGASGEACKKLATKIHSLLREGDKGLEEVYREQETEESGVSVSLSSDLAGDSKVLSEAHIEILKGLQPGGFSEPITQISRDKSTVHRIFHLKSKDQREPEPFEVMYEPIKNQLLNKEFEKETESYIAHLKEYFNFREHSAIIPIPKEYQPFTLN